MKSHKTCAQIVTFNNVANAYLAKFSGDTDQRNPCETKLCAPIRKIQKTEVSRVFEAYNDRLMDIRRDNCAVHPETQIILRETNGQYAYTREGEKACAAEIKKLNAEKFEINGYDGTFEMDLSLTAEEKEAFAGFVLPEQEGDGA